MAIAPNPLQAFIWGRGGAALTPEQVAREREIAEALMKEGADYSPVGHWLQGAARLGNTLSGKIKEGRAASQEAEGRAAYKSLWDSAFGGGGQSDVAASLAGSPATSAAMATAPAPDYASARVAQAHGDSGGSFLPASFLSALDKTEGGGSYDTLFGHARRSGPFAGTAVSKMPISEVLAFASPSGAYGQHVKSKVGQVATPMGRHQIVGTTLRNAVKELGIDPSTLFDAQTQDRIAGHLARKRLASSSTMDGKIAALRSEWEGFKNVPRSQLEVIIRDLESAPSDPVAANEAMASGGLANPPLSPDAVQQWAAQNYAPGKTAGVTVAETPEEILAAEAAMAASPGAQPRLPQAAPMLPEPTMVQDLPVAEIAQSLTNANVNPDMPLAGGTQGFAPLGTQAPNVSLPEGASFSLPDPSMAVAQSLAAQPQQQGGMPNMQQLMQLASDPWANDAQRQVAAALMKQQMEQNDPMRQLEMQKAQLEIEAMRNPQKKPIEVGGVLLDPNTMQPIFDSRQQATPASIQEYQFYANQAAQAGQQPMPYDQWDIARRQSGATQVNVGGEGAPGLGKLSPDYGYVLDPNSRQPVIDPATGLPQAAPVPGSPADIAAQEANRMRAGQEGQSQRYGKIVGEDIGRVLAAVEENPNTIAGPLGSILASVPGTGAHDVSNMLNTIRANVGFDRLQDMRANSPTGGALGAVSDSENKMLQSTLGALEQSQSPKQFATNLRRLQNLYTEIVHGPAPTGVSDDEWTKQAWGLSTTQQESAPVAGSVVDGYRFKGGDPANPNNWEKQ